MSTVRISTVFVPLLLLWAISYVSSMIKKALCSIQPESRREILSMSIAKIMGCEDIPIEHAEVGHFWAKYPELYAKPYPISEEMLGHEVLKYTCLSNRHAKEEYGWSPEISLEEGIRRTVDFSVKAIERANNG